MALYAIGDLHLSLGAQKPMDVFGGNWIGYMDALREGLSAIGAEDTTVLLGDLNWALDLASAKPDAMAVERLYFQNNQKTAIDVAQARGVVLLAAKHKEVPVYEYTPLQVKSAVTGFGRAEKPQVMEMTRRLLRLSEVPKPDDTADALAIAICHGQMGGTALKRSVVNAQLGGKT